MTEPTSEPEQPEAGAWHEEESVPLAARVELLSATCGVSDMVRWIDPDDEGPGRPAGMEKCRSVATLDLSGHIHPPMAAVEAGVAPMCIPVAVGWVFELETLDNLISDLNVIRVELAKRTEGADRG
jgi:hypothetical protein